MSNVHMYLADYSSLTRAKNTKSNTTVVAHLPRSVVAHLPRSRQRSTLEFRESVYPHDPARASRIRRRHLTDTHTCTLPASLTLSGAPARRGSPLSRCRLALHPGRAPSRSVHLPPHMPTHAAHASTKPWRPSVASSGVWPLHHTILSATLRRCRAPPPHAYWLMAAARSASVRP